MCLVTEQKKPKKLKKDLIVYKCIDITEKGQLKSAMQEFWYELNVLYKVKITSSCVFGCFADGTASRKYDPSNKSSDILREELKHLNHITEGFHSMESVKRTKRVWPRTKIFECLIPKGSEIYKDATGLIVSNQIIIVKQVA